MYAKQNQAPEWFRLKAWHRPILSPHFSGLPPVERMLHKIAPQSEDCAKNSLANRWFRKDLITIYELLNDVEERHYFEGGHNQNETQ